MNLPCDITVDTPLPDVTIDAPGSAGVSPPDLLAVLDNPLPVLIEEQPEIGAVVVPVSGPAGQDGTSGPVLSINLEAAMNLSGHRVVVMTSAGLVYADPDDPLHAKSPIYLTVSAIMAFDIGQVVALGDVTEGSWSWTGTDWLFLGLNGTLTETAPTTTVYLRVLGAARNATSIQFDPQTPIFLS